MCPKVLFVNLQNHQDSTFVEIHIETENIGIEEENKVLNLHESVSVDKEGRINVTINNLSISDAYN